MGMMQVYDFGPLRRGAVHRRYQVTESCEAKEFAVLFGAPMAAGSSVVAVTVLSKYFPGIRLIVIMRT